MSNLKKEIKDDGYEIEQIGKLLSGELMQELKSLLSEFKKSKKDLELQIAKGWDNTGLAISELLKEIREGKINTQNTEVPQHANFPELIEWKIFWLKHGFNIEIEKIIVPFRNKKCQQLIVVPKEMTKDWLINKFYALGMLEMEYELSNFKIIGESTDRSLGGQDYAIWIPATKEPQLFMTENEEKDCILLGLTFEEFFVYALYFFEKYGSLISEKRKTSLGYARYMLEDFGDYGNKNRTFIIKATGKNMEVEKNCAPAKKYFVSFDKYSSDKYFYNWKPILY